MGRTRATGNANRTVGSERRLRTHMRRRRRRFVSRSRGIEPRAAPNAECHDVADVLLVEHADDAKRDIPAFCEIRSVNFPYINYGTREEQLYDLRTDPYELSNVAGDQQHADVLARHRNNEQALCSPLPPGVS